MKNSGESKDRVKNEGSKNTAPAVEKNAKKVTSVRGGDNGAMSDEDLDEDEIQQAGGNNNGGVVPGAFGQQKNNEKVKSGGQGQISDGM